MKIRCAVLLRLGLKGVKIFWNVSKVCIACTLVDQIGIQIYDHILKNCSKGKLRRAVSTGLGLKVVKIAWNIAKVGVHACLSNMHPNLSSDSNFENLVKAKTPSCSFIRVWLKDAENSSQHRESLHALLSSNWVFKSMIKFNSKKLVKSETPLWCFSKVGVKGSTHFTIKWASKSMIKFQFQEIGEKWNSIVHFR